MHRLINVIFNKLEHKTNKIKIVSKAESDGDEVIAREKKILFYFKRRCYVCGRRYVNALTIKCRTTFLRLMTKLDRYSCLWIIG